MHTDPTTDLLLIVFGYSIAILTRFRVIIIILNTAVFFIRSYQWFTKNRVDIDEHLASYIHRLKVAESMIFPVVFSIFSKRPYKKRKPTGLNAELSEPAAA